MTSTQEPARLAEYQARLGARLAEYQARLAQLLVDREVYRAEHNDQKVRLLNRQIRGQTKWIRKANQKLDEGVRGSER